MYTLYVRDKVTFNLTNRYSFHTNNLVNAFLNNVIIITKRHKNKYATLESHGLFYILPSIGGVRFQYMGRLSEFLTIRMSKWGKLQAPKAASGSCRRQETPYN